MKTADRENQNRYTSVVATRDHGTQDQNHPAQRGPLDGKKNSGRRRSVFSLTPFMELIRRWEAFLARRYTLLLYTASPASIVFVFRDTARRIKRIEKAP
jgi:hypothetical protein